MPTNTPGEEMELFGEEVEVDVEEEEEAGVADSLVGVVDCTTPGSPSWEVDVTAAGVAVSTEMAPGLVVLASEVGDSEVVVLSEEETEVGPRADAILYEVEVVS